MRVRVFIFLVTVIGGVSLLFGQTIYATPPREPIYYFYSETCPHCANVRQLFDSNGWFDEFNIIQYEVQFDLEGRTAFQNTMQTYGIPVEQWGVPTVIIGEAVLIGDQPIIEQFYERAVKYHGVPLKDETSSEVPVDLTVFAVVAASLVDAINPCAFAVLIILVTTVLATGGGKKALWSGLAFAASIFISYLLMGLGVYQALSIGGISNVFFKIVGWLAIFLGLLNLKDYFWYGKGFLMEVPMSWRPKLQTLIKSVTSPIGAFGIGLLVSLFLLPCTSGPYIVILGMLSESSTFWEAFVYLILYNAIFVLPMILITLAVYKGYDPAGFEQKRKDNVRLLHLIAGVILIAMGSAIVLGFV